MSTMTKNQRKYAIMREVEERYEFSRRPDGEFAKMLSIELGFEVKRASITQARIDLGIPSNGPARAESEVSRLKDLFLRCEYALSQVGDWDGTAEEIAEAKILRAEVQRLKEMK